MKTMFAVGYTTPVTIVIRYSKGPGRRPRRKFFKKKGVQS